MDNRWKDPGFLQQYGAYVLEEAGNRFYYELGIPKEVKINHEHAEHAKYADVVSYILKNWQKKPELIEEEAKRKALEKGPDEIPNPTNGPLKSKDKPSKG